MAAHTRLPYEDTDVEVYKTRGEIDKLLRTAGATGIAWAEGDHPNFPNRRVIALRFIRQEQTGAGPAPIAVRVMVPVPLVKNPKEQEQLLRAYHRSLSAYLKAQFDSINRGIMQFTAAFFAHLELSNGLTVYEQIGPEYLQGAALGEIRPLALLPGGR